MKNKWIINSIMVLIFIITNSFLIYPQEQKEIIDTKTSCTDLNLIEKNSIFSIFPYKLSIGQELSYNDTLRIVKSLKINEALLKEEKNYRIISNVISFVYATGLLVVMFSGQVKITENMPYMLVATVGLGAPFFVTKNMSEKKLDKAVQNYNLYVMGLQIPND